MKPLADIAGDNAVHTLTTDKTLFASAVYFNSVGGQSRVGDSTVDSSHGVAVPSNAAFHLFTPAGQLEKFRLADISAYVATGATLTVSYVPAL